MLRSRCSRAEMFHSGCLQLDLFDGACRATRRWSTVTRIAKELTVPYRSVTPATGEVLKPFTKHRTRDDGRLGHRGAGVCVFGSMPIRRARRSFQASPSLCLNGRAIWQGDVQSCPRLEVFFRYFMGYMSYGRPYRYLCAIAGS